MEVGKFEPEYVEKGEIEPEKLAEIYSVFGLYFRQNADPIVEIEDLENRYGDISNELVYLDRIDALELEGGQEVRMRESERKVAKRMAKTVYLGDEEPGTALANETVREYILEPEINEEERNSRINESHNPNLRQVAVTLDALEEEPARPEEVVKKMPGDPNYDHEFWLRYLETQGAAYRQGDAYALEDEAELLTRTRKEMERIPDSLREEANKDNHW